MCVIFICTQRAKIIQDLKIRKGARKKIRPAECQGIRLFLSGYWPPHSLITNVMFIPLSCLYPVRHVMYPNSISYGKLIPSPVEVNPRTLRNVLLALRVGTFRMAGNDGDWYKQLGCWLTIRLEF